MQPRRTIFALAAVAIAALLLPRAAAAQTVNKVDARLKTETDRAIRRGLEWLVREQNPHGLWVGDVGHKQEDDYVLMDTAERQRSEGEAHVGVSALAGLAFLAGGHVPGRGEFAPVVQRTIEGLIRTAGEDGYFTQSGTRMYSHGFATLFLAQALGMDRRPDLKPAVQNAVDLIVSAQNHQGGWRYNPFVSDADLSVTVTQLQALRAARDVGVTVPKSTIDRAVAYLNRSRIGYDNWGGEGAFYYKIEGRGARSKTSFAVNAAALTALTSAGEYDFHLLEPAYRFIEEEYDSVSRYYGTHFYYWYGNYYACQAMYQLGGPRFERYYEKVRQDLLRRQRSDGSWPNPLECGPGPAFATAVACILLQVPHQLLPIFER
jgi:hypothetical protein